MHRTGRAPSDCICWITGTWPQMFLSPCAAQASASSAIVDEGVIGKMAQTSLTRYAMWAAAVLPSITTDLADMVTSPTPGP
jgi:hypothetical protein